MNYASYTRDTTEPLKRIAHGRRFSQIIRLVATPRETDTVLDYGCGDAHLFSHFLGHRRLIGYDPNPKLLAQAAPEVAAACFLSTDIEAIKAQYADRCSLIYSVPVWRSRGGVTSRPRAEAH
jgi:trans-aconitate methyltransferase